MDEARFRALISGENRSLTAAAGRGLLQLLTPGYALAIALRNAAFDLGALRSHAAGVPVLSVGNLTTGGTGKTPFVAFLADWFQQRQRRVCLLSRGYRALPGAANDEKLVLDAMCPGVPHVQNPNRVAGARTAITEHRAQLLILDDGFQHRRLARDLDIVLVDALNPWGYDHLLPRGLLREPLRALRRADLVVITRADACPASRLQAIRNRLRNVRGSDEHVAVAYPPIGLINSSRRSTAADQLRGTRLGAFCGIGNPAGFRQTLVSMSCPVPDDCFWTFPDHHHYSAAELEQLGRQAHSAGVAALLTTLKDLVKINRDELGGVPLWAVEIGTRILAGEDRLQSALQSLLDARDASAHSTSQVPATPPASNLTRRSEP